MKAVVVIIVLIALVISIVPQFTDCLSQGLSIQLANGTSLPMKCHWTAMAMIGVGIPLAGAGALLGWSKRRETRRNLGFLVALLGVSAILVPTVLIGGLHKPRSSLQLGHAPYLDLGGRRRHRCWTRHLSISATGFGACMNIFDLAFRNITGSAFRSWIVFLCVLFSSGLYLSTMMILGGAQNSLELASERLGADVIVVPKGAEEKVETALLMGNPAQTWMPVDTTRKIRQVRGVKAASPKLYLSTLKNASCCSASEMFIVAFDPDTDFTLLPWLEQNLPGGLKPGEAIGGLYVLVPPGEQNIKVFGYPLALKGNLEPTGTNLDQTLFLTVPTAQEIAALSTTRAEQPLVIPPDSVSAVLVRVAPGYEPGMVAAMIRAQVPEATPVLGSQLFQSVRLHIAGLLRVMAAMLAIVSMLSLAFTGLAFSMAANERRRELGVLRAVGATPAYIFGSLLIEAEFLAACGAISGLVVSALAVYLFRNWLVGSLGMPFLFPSVQALLSISALGLVFGLIGVGVAVLFPAIRISRLDPAIAMRD